MYAGKRTDPEKTVKFMNDLIGRYKVTVPEIADWLGISPNQVYGWRGGKIGFKKVHLLALAAVIEVRFNNLINCTEDAYKWFDSVEDQFKKLLPDDISNGGT